MVSVVLDDSVRLEKAAFVSGLQGTSVAEVLALALLSPLSFAALAALGSGRLRRRGWAEDAILFSAAVVVPLTLALTVMADALAWLAALQLALLSACAARALRAGWRPSWPASLTAPSSSSSAFISAYRVALLMSTAVAILGVDFPVFPRRLAKTEAFGISPVSAGVKWRRGGEQPPPT